MAVAKKRCPKCGSVVEGHPNKKFCGQRCKDSFHNWANPRGYYKHLNSDNDEFYEDDSWLGSPMQSGVFGHGQN